MAVTFALAEEVSRLAGQPLGRRELEAAIASGRAREAFERWAALQGADPAWLRAPRCDARPGRAAAAARRGPAVLAAVDVRQLGLLLVEAGGGRARPEDAIDFGISLETLVRLGAARSAAGEELARVYLRREDDGLAAAFAALLHGGGSGRGAAAAISFGGMKAAILAVGSELLGTDRLDTNSLRLTELLDRYGVELLRKAVIGDSEAEVAAEVRALLPRVDLILITGGLGPTADDVTREAVAAALGRPLRLDTAVAGDARSAASGRSAGRCPRSTAGRPGWWRGRRCSPTSAGSAPGLRDRERAAAPCSSSPASPPSWRG